MWNKCEAFYLACQVKTGNCQKVYFKSSKGPSGFDVNREKRHHYKCPEPVSHHGMQAGTVFPFVAMFFLRVFIFWQNGAIISWPKPTSRSCLERVHGWSDNTGWVTVVQQKTDVNRWLKTPSLYMPIDFIFHYLYLLYCYYILIELLPKTVNIIAIFQWSQRDCTLVSCYLVFIFSNSYSFLLFLALK